MPKPYGKFKHDYRHSRFQKERKKVPGVVPNNLDSETGARKRSAAVTE